MSRLSIRSLKFSTVSIANVSDHIQTFLKWSLVPLAALATMAFVSTTLIRWRILPQGCDVAGGVLQLR